MGAESRSCAPPGAVVRRVSRRRTDQCAWVGSPNSVVILRRIGGAPPWPPAASPRDASAAPAWPQRSRPLRSCSVSSIRGDSCDRGACEGGRVRRRGRNAAGRAYEVIALITSLARRWEGYEREFDRAGRSRPHPAPTPPTPLPGLEEGSDRAGPRRGRLEASDARTMAAEAHPEPAARRNQNRERRRSDRPVLLLRGSLYQLHPRVPVPGRAQHPPHLHSAAQQVVGTARYRSRASGVGDQRQFPFPNSLRCESERFRNVLRFQVRIQGEDLRHSHPFGDHVDHDRDRDTQSTNARRTARLIGTNGDSRETHGLRLAYEALRWGLTKRPGLRQTGRLGKSFDSSGHERASMELPGAPGRYPFRTRAPRGQRSMWDRQTGSLRPLALAVKSTLSTPIDTKENCRHSGGGEQ